MHSCDSKWHTQQEWSEKLRPWCTKPYTVSVLLAIFHQASKEVDSSWGRSSSRLIYWRKKNQNWRAKTQEWTRWSMVSSSWSQSKQCCGWSRPLRAKRSAIQHALSSTSHITKKKKGTGRCPGFSDSLIRPDLSSFQEKPYMHLWLSLYRWMKGITGEHFRLQAVAASWTGYPIAVNTQQWFPLGLLIENQKSKPYLRQPQGQFIRWFFNWEWWHRAEELHQQPIFHAISDLPKIRYVLHHQVQPELPQKSRLELCQGLVLAVMPISFFKTQHNSLRLDMARPPSSKGRQTVPQATRQCPPLVYLWPLHL